MGGRGAASGAGGSGGLEVTKDGQTTRYYFESRNGVNYYQRGIGGTPEPTPMNMTAKEFRRRVEAGGASTRGISSAEKAREQKARKAEREATDRFLNIETASNRSLSSGSRAEAKTNRANRRLRRGR